MNQDESFEAELRKLGPARPPEELLNRLARRQATEAADRATALVAWRHWLRWLAPAAAVVLLVALILHSHPLQHRAAAPIAAHTRSSALDTNNVEFNQQLVAAFDAVARLPDGQPVRFRCREWRDQVTVRDPARGLVIEQQTPRLEIVPVSYDIY